ncbi:MAG: 5-nucleotidase SurE [Candidatus Poribacteria bacterium]|nr:5-nucleotidase SurE [Candidatus Poribacteria bacterium]
MIILVTNDDGINSEGIRVLADAMSEIGEVFIVAPDRQRSAVGLSITLDQPLRVERLSDKKFSVNGMPTDCVELAIYKLMETPPDLVISGINDGQNLGYDIYHSGTVGAAITGTMFGIPSIAISIALSDEYQNNIRYDTAANIAVKVSKAVIENKIPHGKLLNVNVPNLPISELEGIEITRHCNATYDIEIHHRKDPRGKEYFWVGGIFQTCGDHSKTDLEALKNNKVSITPLHLDLTDYEMMKKMSNWF